MKKYIISAVVIVVIGVAAFLLLNKPESEFDKKANEAIKLCERYIDGDITSSFCEKKLSSIYDELKELDDGSARASVVSMSVLLASVSAEMSDEEGVKEQMESIIKYMEELEPAKE